jgi:excisionase family DNA binding protein
MVDTKYYTVAEIAELLKVSRQTVYNWIESGQLAAVQAGRAVRVPASSLAAFLRPASGPEGGSGEWADDSAG